MKKVNYVVLSMKTFSHVVISMVTKIQLGTKTWHICVYDQKMVISYICFVINVKFWRSEALWWIPKLMLIFF